MTQINYTKDNIPFPHNGIVRARYDLVKAEPDYSSGIILNYDSSQQIRSIEYLGLKEGRIYIKTGIAKLPAMFKQVCSYNLENVLDLTINGRKEDFAKEVNSFKKLFGNDIGILEAANDKLILDYQSNSRAKPPVVYPEGFNDKINEGNSTKMIGLEFDLHFSPDSSIRRILSGTTYDINFTLTPTMIEAYFLVEGLSQGRVGVITDEQISMKKISETSSNKPIELGKPALVYLPGSWFKMNNLYVTKIHREGLMVKQS